MQGCTLLRLLVLSSFLLVPTACRDARPESRHTLSSRTEASTLFDPEQTGSIHGNVSWVGEVPSVRPFKVRTNGFWTKRHLVGLIRENPNQPEVNAQSGVENAVVFLRRVDPRKAKPWHHDPVRIVHDNYRLQIHQGERAGRIGFVSAGDDVEVISKQDVFHMLRGRGGDFFSLPLVDANVPLTRTLSSKGVIELTSGAGYYWIRGYLFVDDHPYYTLTDSQGNFELRDVPDGSYEVVCWMPNWKTDHVARDPESGMISRLHLRPSVEQTLRVEVRRGEKSSVEFTIYEDLFD